MKFSEQWLREWVQPKTKSGEQVSTEQLAHQVTMAGLEVDGIEAVAGEFSGVVVGEVVKREQHPDADKLSLCQVSDGTETFQIVCAAIISMVSAEFPADCRPYSACPTD